MPKPMKPLKRKLVAGILAGSLALGALGCGPTKPAPTPKPTKRVERVNVVPKEQPKNTIYESREQKSKPIVDAKKLEQQRKRVEQEKARLEEINKREDFIGSFLEDPVQGIKKIRSIKNKELRDKYAYWALDGASNIVDFERVYNACKDREFQKELIKSFGDSFVGAADGGFQHAYEVETILQIKNSNLRQSVFERILYGSKEQRSERATVLDTLHHQDEYDALIRVAKTLPNAKKYILDLQKQKKKVGRGWE
jgi:hypothetical protein